MKKTLLVISWSILMLPELCAQSKLGMEHYQYWNQPGEGAVVPVLHFSTRDNWYAELRYNYEEASTLSLFAGRSFSGGKSITYAMKPMIGFSTGGFTGISVGFNGDMEWKDFYLSSQNQYSLATKENADNFFFSWSELGYTFHKNFFAGVAVQYTVEQGPEEFHPGLMAGINIKDFSFPFYVFNPFDPGQYFIMGVSYEYSFKKRNKARPL